MTDDLCGDSDEMTKTNDGMRGTWIGDNWACDCGQVEVIMVHGGDNSLFPGKLNPLWKYYCDRCQIYRPLKKDKNHE